MPHEFIYGVQPVLQVLLAKRRKVFQLFFHRTHLKDELKQILNLVHQENIRFEEVDKHQLSQLAESPHHQGVVLKVENYSYTLFDDLIEDLKVQGKGEEGRLVLILDQVQDPQNLGAILRTAHCAGVGGVILPDKGSAGVTPAVMKASAGGAEQIKVALVRNLSVAIDVLQQLKFWVYGCEAGEGSSFWEQNFQGRVALLLGSEGIGVRSLLKKKCDFLISVPLLGSISSLNVSVTTGILLYEVLRQRKNLKIS